MHLKPISIRACETVSHKYYKLPNGHLQVPRVAV